MRPNARSSGTDGSDALGDGHRLSIRRTPNQSSFFRNQEIILYVKCRMIFGNMDACQVLARRERVIADGRDAVGDGYAFGI